MLELLNNRLTVLCGNFGSGKTELSIAAALDCARVRPTVLCDMDIVNPYFRSSEKTDLLTSAGVRVISPVFARTNVDVPSLPPEIQSVFVNKNETVVFDVGGDDAGAVALGGYAGRISAEKYGMYMVVNAYRPMTSTPDDIAEMARRIMYRSRLAVTGLINNSNLGASTDADAINASLDTVEKAASLLGVGVAAVTVDRSLTDPKNVKAARVIPFDTVMKPEWLLDT